MNDEFRAALAKHRWRPGEREALRASIAERQVRGAAGEEPELWRRPEPEAEARKSSKLTEAEASKGAWQAWIDRISGDVKSLKKNINGAVADVLAEETIARWKAVTELRRENETLDGMIDNAQRWIDELRLRFDTLDSTFASLQRDGDAIASRVDALTMRLDTLAAQLDRLPAWLDAADQVSQAGPHLRAVRD